MFLISRALRNFMETSEDQMHGLQTVRKTGDNYVRQGLLPFSEINRVSLPSVSSSASFA